MGVDATAVVMYGVKFDEVTEELDNLISAMYDDNDNDMFVYDQMNGQYLILGHIYSYQDVYSDYEFVEISVSDLDKASKDYHTKFMNNYPEWADVLVGKEFKLLSFVHYS